MTPSDLSSRLTPLHDGRPGIRGSLQTDVRQPVPSPGGEGQGEGGTAVLDFISSDPTLDRYAEIIEPAGWQLASYLRNPVFQNAHQYGDIMFTLGKALITEVREVGRVSPSAPPRLALFQRIEFATAANPMAKIAHALYSGKFLSTVSVGFIPLRWEDGTAQSPFRRRYLEQELLEVSAVAIPANPNALALAYKSGAIEKSDLRDLSDLINYTLAGPIPFPRSADFQSASPPLSPAPRSAELHSAVSPIFNRHSADAHSASDPTLAAVLSPSPRGEGQGEGEWALPLARALREILKHT